MSTKNIIKDNIVLDDDGYKLIGEAYDNEELVTVLEKINPDNTRYSYIETYQNENGIVIIGTTSELCLDKNGNTIPKRARMGIWYYDKVFLNVFRKLNDVLDNFNNSDEPIYDLEDFNSDLYYEKHILPDIFVSSLVYLKNEYNNAENIKYNVEKQISDGSRVNLSFTYPCSTDYRKQLSNLYNSVIDADNLTEKIFNQLGFGSILRPDSHEVALFDGKETLNNMKKKTTKVISKK